MGFERAAPQRAVHPDGYSVYIGGRDHIVYESETGSARMRTELPGGASVPLYTSTLMWYEPDHRTPTEEESETIRQRIVAGLEALGVVIELL